MAIKVLPATFSQDADRLKRFEAEARAAGVLNHPNITAVYDFGAVNGSPYIVTELLEGAALNAAGAVAFGPARVTPDGKTIIAGYGRILSTLYRVTDLRCADRAFADLQA